MFPLAIAATAVGDDTIVDPGVTRFVLDNGLTVILSPEAQTGVIGMLLRYRAGVRDEPAGRPGLTALLTRLMVRQTVHVGDGQYHRLLAQAGGADAEESSQTDRTTFAVSVPSEQLALPLWLWSDQMGYFLPTLDQKVIDQEGTRLHESRLQRVDNVPAGRAGSFLLSALYPDGHPYRSTGWPTDDSLRGLTVQELRAFAEPRYGPDNAILVMTGDFDPRRARSLIEKYFGSLARKKAPPRSSGAPPQLTGETRLKMAAQVELPSVSIAWLTPPLGADGDAELDVIAELLTGHRAGVLRWKLVDELKIASTVTARQFSRQLGSRFVITALASPGHTPDELVQAVDGVLATLREKPYALRILRWSVADFLIDPLFNLEKSSTRAFNYAGCEDEDTPGSCVRTWWKRHTNLTSATLSAVAARELPRDRRVIVEVMPARDAPIAGELQQPGGHR